MSPRGVFDEMVSPNRQAMVLPPMNRSTGKGSFVKLPLHAQQQAPSPLTKPSQPRKVTFNTRVNVRCIQSIFDMPEEDIEATWFTESENREIKENVKLAVRRMKISKGKSPDEDRVSYRGLEGRSKESMRRRSRSRSAVWVAVFLEQEKQFKEDRVDMQAICQASSTASLQSRMIARNMAILDEQAVAVYRRTRTSSP